MDDFDVPDAIPPHKFLLTQRTISRETAAGQSSTSLTDLRSAGQFGAPTTQPPTTARWSGQDSILNTLAEESQTVSPCNTTLGVPQRRLSLSDSKVDVGAMHSALVQSGVVAPATPPPSESLTPQANLSGSLTPQNHSPASGATARSTCSSTWTMLAGAQSSARKLSRGIFGHLTGEWFFKHQLHESPSINHRHQLLESIKY